ncbi:MAG: FG-GAP-like repeat-containing protein [Candidatus Helarchaeota archaeon]
MLKRKKRQFLKKLAIVVTLLIIVIGIFIQIGLISRKTPDLKQVNQSEVSNSLNATAVPELKLQWIFNASSYGTGDTLFGLATGDGNGDGVLELAVVGEKGLLYCLNGTDGACLWEYNLSAPEYSIAFGDVNGDHKDEVIASRFITPGPPSKKENITVFDFNSHQPISNGYQISVLSPVNIVGVGSGNLRNISKDDVIVLDSQGILYMFDGATNTQLDKDFALGVIDFALFNQGFDINAGDINLDGIQEILISGINQGKTNGITRLMRWDRGELSVGWDFILNTSAYCATADFGDINGDGKAEVIVGTRQNGGTRGGDVFLLDGEIHEIIWKYNTSSNNVYDISAGDMHADGKDEFAIGVGGDLNYTYVLEGENNSILWEIPSGYAINGVELADINNDGKSEIITMGNDLVKLYCVDSDGDGLSDMDDLDDDNDNLTDFQETILFQTNQFLVDSDFDNLSDTIELLTYGTNPSRADTDNDNLSDWQELYVYYTMPNNTNSDGDYLTDWEEIFVYSTNPTDPDSDNDGLLDGEVRESSKYSWLFYNLLTLIITTSILFAVNLRYLFKFRQRAQIEAKSIEKTKSMREIIKSAVWFWGHGSHVLKNFDKLIASGVKTITLDALTRTWTQHYKKTFKKVFKLTEEEASQRAEAQKKKEILELYDLLKDKIDIQIVPITFGKYAGSNSYQFEVCEDELREPPSGNNKNSSKKTEK